MNLLHCAFCVFTVIACALITQSFAKNHQHWQSNALLLAIDVDEPYYALRFTYPRSPLFESSVFQVFTDGINYTYDPKNVSERDESDDVAYDVSFPGSISQMILGDSSVITKEFRDKLHLNTTGSNDIDGCKGDCSADKSCGAFEFNSTAKTCYLLDGPVPPFFQGAFLYNTTSDVTSRIKNPQRHKLIFKGGSLGSDPYPGYNNCHSITYSFTLDDHEDRGVNYSIYQCDKMDGFVFHTVFAGDFDNTAVESCMFDNTNLDPPFCSAYYTNSPFPNFVLSFRDDDVKGTFWNGAYSFMRTVEFSGGSWETNSSCGPFLLHMDASMLLFAPLESPHDTFVRVKSIDANDCIVQCGVNGFITKMPNGANFSFVVSSGLTFMEPLLNWGRIVQKYASNVSVPFYPEDNPIQKVGYWTDRHSYYSESWFLENPTCSVLQTLSPVKATYDMCETNLDYFFISGIWAGDRKSLFQCIKNDSVDSAVFGARDVVDFISKLNSSIILSIPMLCHGFSGTKEVVDSPTFLLNGHHSQVVLPLCSSKNFWSEVLFQHFFGKSKNSFKHGTFFTDIFRYTSLFPELFTTYHGARYFFGNYSSASVEYSLVTLLDKTSPLDLIEAVYHPTFSAVMAKADITRIMEPLDRSDFGTYSLASALNISVILNSILTGQKVNDSIFRAVLSPMARSTGGFGDQLLRTDPTLLKYIANRKNEVLWPTYGAMPFIDPFTDLSQYNNSVVSVTILGQWRFYQVMFVQTPPFFRRNMFPFPILDTDAYVSLDLLDNLPYCCNGCDASLCVNSNPFDPDTNVSTSTNKGLFLLSPQVSCGDLVLYLLGESGKAISVSATRFAGMKCSDNAVIIDLRGSFGEIINIMFLVQQIQRGNMVQQLEVNFTGTTGCFIQCQGFCSVKKCY